MPKRQKKRTFVFFAILCLLGIAFVTSYTSKKVTTASSCTTSDLSGEIRPLERLAIFEGRNINVPTLAIKNTDKDYVLGVSSEERWVEVDLSDQKLKAWEGGNLYLETLISTGLPWWPTPTGEFRVWAKMRATRMEGGEGKYYYNLPNVPYVMFFENETVPGYRGFGLHGTYWHSDFGTRRSHGCVNLPTEIAEKLYYWTGPVMPQGKSYVRSSSENPGTRVIIHE